MLVVHGWEDGHADKLHNVPPLVTRVLCEALLFVGGDGNFVATSEGVFCHFVRTGAKLC